MKIKGIEVLSLLLVLPLAMATPLASANDAAQAKRLTGQIDYQLVPNPKPTDDEGRLLVWEGTIEGDINGTMRWWFGPSPASQPPFPGGRVAYYAARWEIWDEYGDELLLAGESAGKTMFPAGFPAEASGIWDGHGVVTEARKGFNPLKGRHIYETGPVILPEGGGLLYGTGMFVIY